MDFLYFGAPQPRGGNLLLTAQDIDGYSLTYTYTGGIAGRAARVASVTEKDDSTQGGSLTIT